MNKTLYIIPGWQETTKRQSYQKLRLLAQKKGYSVIFHNIDWKKPLSQQTLSVPKNSIVFGFSLGAILAWLIAQNNPCELLILASMTPHKSFNDKTTKKALIEITGKAMVSDIIKNLKTNHKALRQVILYGDKENEKADILVKNTDHEITENYLNEIKKILK